MTTLAASQFQRISALAQQRWGLCLTEKKMPLVSNRLSSFLRKSPFASIDEYLAHLESEATEQDMLVFFDILSTNVTSFFRDPAHFDCLERELWAPLANGTTTRPGRRVRLWSAGCSIGCEPYSMAINAIENMPDLSAWDVKILASDLSNYAVQEAKAGMYDAKTLETVPAELLRRHFAAVKGGPAGQYAVAEHLRRLVTVAQVNLMGQWPFKGPFDVIFCRNVMIYFDAPTRQRLVSRFHQMLSPGGLLAVGSAETLSGLDVPFQTVQASVYRKV